jgi:hypothetical protein
LAFGVEKVIWIFTDTKKVLIAASGKNWTIAPWDQEVAILPNVSVNIAKLLRELEL